MNTREHEKDGPEKPTSRPGRGGNIPPIEHRWTKGRSANPAGRPRGSRDSFEVVIRRELNRRVAGNPSLDGKARISRRTRLVRAILNRVEAGDTRAATLLLDRVWPVPMDGAAAAQPFVVIFDDQDRLEMEGIEDI